jgi:hypothetical protein
MKRLTLVTALLGALAATALAVNGQPRHHGAPRHGVDRIPMAARGPVSAALGRHDARYRVAGGRLRNPAQRLRARFSRAGVTVASGGSRVRLRLERFGRATVQRRIARVAPRARRNRVDYARGGVDEWYANGPLGLEQGFDVGARPRGAGPLTLSLARTPGARPAGGDVELGHALRFGGLTASDARGRTLPARFVVRAHRVQIRVDDASAQYPVRVDPFVRQATLRASDAKSSEGFGAFVAADGDTIVATKVFPGGAGTSNSGPVYVFQKPASGWADAVETAKLSASDAVPADFDTFDSVAISGDTVVAGAPGHTVGGKKNTGAVYVFVKPAGGWHDMHQTAELTASDGAGGDGFGSVVATSGDTVVATGLSHRAGANEQQGAGYVFEKPASGWADGHERAKLTASDGGTRDAFAAVAMSTDTIVLGAGQHDVGTTRDQGAAYVYTKPAGDWVDAVQTSELTASDGGADVAFGSAVAISGDTVVAGAPFRHMGEARTGAAYVFTKPAAGWAPQMTESAQLTAPDASDLAKFGLAAAMAGDRIVVGAFDQTVGKNLSQGEAYVFTRPRTGGWKSTDQAEILRAQDGAFGDNFGSALATTGSVVVVGAHAHAAPGVPGAGAVYVFGPKPPPPPPPVRLAITRVKQSARRWRRATTFSFRLNKPARVTLRFTHRVHGHSRRAGSLTVRGRSGANRIRFHRRVAGGRRLKPGRYSLRLTATTPAGQRATSRTLRFTITR